MHDNMTEVAVAVPGMMERADTAREAEKTRELERAAAEAAAARALADRFTRLAAMSASEFTVSTNGDDHAVKSCLQVLAADVRQAGVFELAGWKFSDVQDRAAAGVTERFVEQVGRHKLTLVIVGGTGAGKTSLAITAGRSAARLGHRTRFVRYSEYLAQCRAASGFKPAPGAAQWCQAIRSTPVLVLDDLGAGEPVGVMADAWVVKATTELVDARVGSGLTTIVTTNLSSEDLQVMYGDRLTSRIGEAAVVASLRAVDLRKPVTWG